MIVLETIVAAFSMFSRIPMPKIKWSERNMKFMLCAFPLIGAVIGGLEVLVLFLCSIWAIPFLIKGAVLCAIPALITGGIHIDGFCDTWDAICARQGRARSLEIMKDPHIGSFAVIHLVIWFVFYFALWSCSGIISYVPVCLSFVLSRCLSGLAAATFKPAKRDGLGRTFNANSSKKTVAIILIIAIILLSAVMCIFVWQGIFAVAAALVWFGIYFIYTRRKFGGVTGDTAGWFLQICELLMLGGMVVGVILEGKI